MIPMSLSKLSRKTIFRGTSSENAYSSSTASLSRELFPNLTRTTLLKLEQSSNAHIKNI